MSSQRTSSYYRAFIVVFLIFCYFADVTRPPVTVTRAQTPGPHDETYLFSQFSGILSPVLKKDIGASH